MTIEVTSVTANTPPTITQLTGPIAPVALGQTITVRAWFTDPDVGDTHTALFSWDDGTTSPGTISAGVATASHTYAGAGVSLVTVTITDSAGGVATGDYDYIVVYDPSGGFVTGGGWIYSPAGAYPADPTLAGKASFGFVSKYKKGANAPTGETEFQFHATSFNFKSTSYEWLVVAGKKAQYKGEGTVNGAGAYKFMLDLHRRLPRYVPYQGLGQGDRYDCLRQPARSASTLRRPRPP